MEGDIEVGGSERHIPQQEEVRSFASDTEPHPKQAYDPQVLIGILKRQPLQVLSIPQLVALKQQERETVRQLIESVDGFGGKRTVPIAVDGLKFFKEI